MKGDREKTLSIGYRLILGAGLGALIGLIVGWAAAGGWNSLYLAGIPTELHTQAIQKGTLLGAGMGAIWGMIFAWPPAVASDAGLITIGIALAFVLGLGFLAQFVHLPSLVETIRVIAPWVLIPTFGLIRLSITLVERGGARSRTLKVAAVGLSLVVVVFVALSATWSIDQLWEAIFQVRRRLTEVHELSLANGWEVALLEVEGDMVVRTLGDPHPGVRVHLSNGDEFFCTYPPGAGPVCPSLE